jgi:hypothetical protein
VYPALPDAQITGGEAMSEIPDWLVELAAHQGEEDDDDESEWDFLQAEPAEDSYSASNSAQSSFSEPAMPFQALSAAEAAAQEDDDLMADLRSQVEIVEPEEAPAAKSTKSALDYRVAGLRPWQQLVLSVLVFLDVGIIGLLFLVMLERIVIP